MTQISPGFASGESNKDIPFLVLDLDRYIVNGIRGLDVEGDGRASIQSSPTVKWREEEIRGRRVVTCHKQHASDRSQTKTHHGGEFSALLQQCPSSSIKHQWLCSFGRFGPIRPNLLSEPYARS